MHTLKLSVSLPDETHPDMELRLSANDSACDVVIALPVRSHEGSTHITVPGTAARNAAPLSDDDRRQGAGADDEYVLGGYAGI